MRILVLSDTHGHLHIMNELASKHKVDAIVHCGDFGFMSTSRIKGIPDRELSLLVHHSHLKEEMNVWDLDYEDKLQFVVENGLLGEFDNYLDGENSFDIPIYAVEGNHDDNRVAQDLISGRTSIPNLHIITPESDIVLDDWIRLVGVGGNMSIHSFLSKRKKQSFHSRTHFDQWVQVHKTLEEKRNKGEKVWFITHVSPGKQPILELLSLHLKPNLWFSGHMGVPIPQHYSLRTVNETRQFVRRLQPSIEFLQRKWDELTDDSSKDNRRLGELEEYLYLLTLPEGMKDIPLEEFPLREPRELDRLMKGTFFFNLPDADRSIVTIDTDEMKREYRMEFGGTLF